MQLDRLQYEQALWKKGITLVAGVDEAGRGPLAGPVVAAAVIFPVDFWLEDIDDSKKLNARQRERLYPLILENAVSVGVATIDHLVIDEMNILRASVEAMRKAIAKLEPQPEMVLADGNSFHDELLAYRNIIGGDARSMTIGAASIVAKITRDRLMTELDAQYPLYGFAQHKGYATPQHLSAIAKHGLCDIHRRTFHPRALAVTTQDIVDAKQTVQGIPSGRPRERAEGEMR